MGSAHLLQTHVWGRHTVYMHLIYRSARAAACMGAMALTLGLVACSAPAEETIDVALEDELSGIAPTAIANQTIGNCWAFTTTAWVQRLHTHVGGGNFDLSEAYLSYMYSYEQLLGRSKYSVLPLQEGANFDIARDLTSKYGMRQQSQFAGEGRTGELPAIHTSALAATNLWLKNGGLAKLPIEPAARRAYVRTLLDEFWQLSPAVRSDLDTAFGKDMSRTLVGAPTTTFAKTRILRAEDLSVAIYNPAGATPGAGTLADLVREGGAHRYARTDLANEVTPTQLRAHKRLVQKLLHQGIPVWMSWWMEPGAISVYGLGGKFTAANFLAAGPKPGHTGHATLLYDYEVTLSNGTLLKAGETVADPGLLQAALAENVSFSFWRVQNSWGSAALSLGRPPGVYDLEERYLSEPLPIIVPLGSVKRPFWFGAALPRDMQ